MFAARERMRTIQALGVAITILSAMNAVAADFWSIPPAKSVEESKARFNDRAQYIIDIFKNVPVGGYKFESTGGFSIPALARLHTGFDVESVNRVLLASETKAYSLPGTDFRSAGPFCRREGDYDFMLVTLMHGVMAAWDQPGRLWPETKQKLLKELLSVRGNEHPTRVKLGLCGWFDETENHVLMTESSRYLTNQLLYKEGLKANQVLSEYDNEKNGFNAWLLNHLRTFLVKDFHEYNSKPYQTYSVFALQNLYNYADDARVRLGAQMVLDYISAKFALQSNELRRYPPMRRLVKYRRTNDFVEDDPETQRHALLVGNYDWKDENGHLHRPKNAFDLMLYSALSKYRIPDVIADMIIHKDRFPYFQKMSYDTVELYSSSPSFLISGGGLFTDGPDMGTGLLDGWAMPTLLIPSQAGMKRTELIQIYGSDLGEKRFNTCVAPNFACGMHPGIPDSIPESCRSSVGNNWTFINLNGGKCPLHYGFYVAMYHADCDSWECSNLGDYYGFFEAAEARGMSFEQFKSLVISFNFHRGYHSMLENTYVTTSGHEIKFVPTQTDRNTWPIKAINGERQQTDMTRWNFAEGTVLNSGRNSALIGITNPALKQRLVLDFRDPLNPKRWVEPAR